MSIVTQFISFTSNNKSILKKSYTQPPMKSDIRFYWMIEFIQKHLEKLLFRLQGEI